MENFLLAMVLYAGLSDWLARRLHAVTPLGAVADPLADKLFTSPFLLGVAIASGSMWIGLLFMVNLLYDVDNTYQRRFDIKNAFRGREVKADKPVTFLAKIKTASLFCLVICAVLTKQSVVAVVEYFNSATLTAVTEVCLDYLSIISIDQLAGICLLLVLWSWGLNRRGDLVKLGRYLTGK